MKLQTYHVQRNERSTFLELVDFVYNKQSKLKLPTMDKKSKQENKFP